MTFHLFRLCVEDRTFTFIFISGPPAEAEGVGEHSDSHCSSRELRATVLRGADECSEYGNAQHFATGINYEPLLSFYEN